MMEKAAPARRSWFWLQGAIAGGIAVAAPGTASLLAVLLCPALLFYATEATPGRPVGRTMMLTGSTAAYLPLRDLWEHGGSLGTALDALADPTCPLLGWFACGAGWMMCELLQLAARFALKARTRRQVEELRREHADLSEEWTFSDGRPQS